MRTVWNRLSNQGAYVHHVPASESDVRHGDLASRFHDPVRLAFFAISRLPQTSEDLCGEGEPLSQAEGF